MRRTHIHFCDHAVERFIERFAPELTVAQARAYLMREGPRAVRLKTRTALGQEQWELQDPKCILVVKNSHDIGRVCKTILYGKPDTINGFSEDEMEIIRETAQRIPPIRIVDAPPPKSSPPPKKAPRAPVAVVAKFAPPQAALELHKMLTERANARDREKTLRHSLNMELQLNRQRTALRAALRFILAKAGEGDPIALEVAEEIQAIEAAYVTESFLVGKSAAG